MDKRVEEELALLRKQYEEVAYVPEGRWVKVFPVPTGPGWNRDSIAAAFQIPAGYPGTPPYGFYAETGLTFNGSPPQNYRCPPPSLPPFEGSWGVFSWAHEGAWRPTGDLQSGVNLWNWTRSFTDRFREGA